jgi:hypothetical protein
MDMRFGTWNVRESLQGRFPENSGKRIGKV